MNSIFEVHVSPGSAETLVEYTGCENKPPFDSLFSEQHFCQKNHQYRPMYLRVIASSISVVMGTQCSN